MRRLWVGSITSILLLLLLALPAAADGGTDAVASPTITYAGAAVTLSWLPATTPPAQVYAYFVYYGTAPGAYDPRPYVTNGHIFFITNTKPGQTYYYAIAPYYGGGRVGSKSSELSITIPDPSDPEADVHSAALCG